LLISLLFLLFFIFKLLALLLKFCEDSRHVKD
jgi:hypothetical protein